MGKRAVLFAIILAVSLVLIGARPFPRLEVEGQELLVPEDTRYYYRYPVFWFGRPVYDEDDDYGGNGGRNSQLGRSSTISLASVGAGWGR